MEAIVCVVSVRSRNFVATESHLFAPWSSWRRVEVVTAEWVRWYNHDRLHSSVEDLPPEEFEQIYYDKNRRLSEPAAA